MIIANQHRDPKTKAFTASEFMLTHEKPEAADQQARNRRLFDTLRAVAKPIKRRKAKRRGRK